MAVMLAQERPSQGFRPQGLKDTDLALIVEEIIAGERNSFKQHLIYEDESCAIPNSFRDSSKRINVDSENLVQRFLRSEMGLTQSQSYIIYRSQLTEIYNVFLNNGADFALKVFKKYDLPKMIIDSDAYWHLMVERFQNEYDIMVEMKDHPNILDVYFYMDFFEGDSDLHCYAMPFLEHQTFQDVMPNLSSAQRLSFLNKTAKVLSDLHSKEIVHLDLKPSNLFYCKSSDIKVRQDGLSKILNNTYPIVYDFGISGRNGQVIHLAKEQEHAVFGTILYCAPEMLDFDGKQVYCTADVYSFGCMLYESIVGIQPHFNPDGESMARERFVGILDECEFRLKNANIDPKLQKVVLTSLQRNPNKRYPSMIEMNEALCEIESRR